VRTISNERSTRETSVSVSLKVPDPEREPAPDKGDISVTTGVPFLDHMLEGMLFHGGFSGTVSAKGDTEIDDHHTVEDVGIVLGQAFRRLVETHGPVARFGHAMLPMDDALAEAVVDVSGRSYLKRMRAGSMLPWYGSSFRALPTTPASIFISWDTTR
jgi:imidazoleglycerol-phosphate dehydratase